MDDQLFSRVANSNSMHHTDYHHQISLWSESGANILSLWSVLVVNGFLVSALVIIPLSIYFGLLHWLPHNTLEVWINFLYVDLNNFMSHTLFCAAACIMATKLFHGKELHSVLVRIYLPVYLVIVAFSVPIALSKPTRVMIQRALMVGYCIPLYYMYRHDTNQNDVPNGEKQNPLLTKSTLTSVCKGIVFCFVGFYSILGIYQTYVDSGIEKQLFIRLVLVNMIFFFVEAYQIHVLIALPKNHALICMDVVSAVNAHAQFLGRIMICTVDTTSFDKYWIWMCIGNSIIEIISRLTYNLRYHLLLRILDWYNSKQDVCSRYFYAPICRPWRKKSSQTSCSEKPHINRNGHSASVKNVRLVHVSSASFQKSDEVVIHVRESPDEPTSSEPTHVIEIKENNTNTKSPSLVEEDQQTVDNQTPYSLPSPLKEIRMKQILDDISTDIRVTILVSFFLYFIHPLFLDSAFRTNSNMYEVFYQIGIQILFELASDLFCLYAEIYWYKMELDLSYNDLRESLPMASTLSAFSTLVALNMFSSFKNYSFSHAAE